MKKLLSFAVGAMMMLGVSASQQAKAQVYADFDLELRQDVPYETLVEGGADITTLNVGEFWIPPTKIPNRDDGYCEVTLPFTFQFNGIDYTKVYVCINGFITFINPPNVIANQPEALFTIENSFADNVVAPFWGDHYYRSADDNTGLPVGANQWAPSKILVKKTMDKVVIEWKDLNILDKTVTSSVATFQVILYKSTNVNSTQGDIEFAYNTSGRKVGQQTSETQVITFGSSIGIKGESGILHAPADFMNALFTGSSKHDQITKDSYSEEWQPTGGSDKRFHFIPFYRYTIGSQWGDGDADMSRVIGGLHFGQIAQNRYVTVGDAREIMYSVAINVPLDSIKGRAAFHGDVNHNGRFIYLTNGTKYNILTNSKEYNQDLPAALIGNERQIMFEVSEYDAALIMHYLSARIPSLPWWWEFPQYGKDVEANQQITFGDIKEVSDNVYSFAIINNANINGPLATKFDVNGEIISVTDLSNNRIGSTYNNSRTVLAGNGEFTKGETISYIIVRANSDAIEIKNIRVNDQALDNVTLKLATETETVNGMSNYPNPFNNNTAISVNIEANAIYTLSVFDAKGDLVKTIASKDMKSGINTFTWDGTDNNNSTVESGMYIYRLVGNGKTISNQMMLVK